MMNNTGLINKLNKEKRLSHDDWVRLLSTSAASDREYAAGMANDITLGIFGRKIYFRGIIEFSNYCKNDCYYCGIRRGNTRAVRYRLSPEDILLCCREGFRLGYRTFVLQSGEDAYWNDERLCELISSIKNEYPECAVTLSVGERSRESYERLFHAGADRYLLRHETADKSHYCKIHPADMSFDNRIRCLYDLKEIGFQTGCGMMIGTPFQTFDSIADDMEFMAEFAPHMVGIGPFLPHSDTPFRDHGAGNVEMTLFVLSLTRIMLPNALIPSTTALGTAESDGRIRGVLAGCNVVMPNLSPENVRKSYMLYDNKVGTDLTAKEGLNILKKQMQTIGREVVTGRGDYHA